MTVLQGQVAVIRSNGSAIQPAPSGTTVFPHDEIRTLNDTGALITFFSGTEIELGEDTILIVEQVSREGDSVHVSLVQVFGLTVNRVTSLADSGSSYRIQAGGGVAVVRGTSFALGVMAPFAALGCATGSVAMDIVSCEPGQLLVWEFDQATGTRTSAFQEKSIPAGNLGAALNAVVSAIGELANGPGPSSSPNENEQGVTANKGNTPSGGGGCGSGDGDKGNSEEAHGTVASRAPGSRGECISAAAHDNNAVRLNAVADVLTGLNSHSEQGNNGNDDNRGKHQGNQNGKSSAAKEGNGKSK